MTIQYSVNLSVGILHPPPNPFDKLKDRFEKAGMAKINPIVKQTVANIADIHKQTGAFTSMNAADQFRAKLLASHGRQVKARKAMFSAMQPHERIFEYTNVKPEANFLGNMDAIIAKKRLHELEFSNLKPKAE